jgi:hypothetical protein
MNNEKSKKKVNEQKRRGEKYVNDEHREERKIRGLIKGKSDEWDRDGYFLLVAAPSVGKSSVEAKFGFSFFDGR